jgi:hypothetical protein
MLRLIHKTRRPWARPSRTLDIDMPRELFYKLKALEDTPDGPRYDSSTGRFGKLQAFAEPKGAWPQPRKLPQMCSVQYNGKRVWVGALTEGLGRGSTIYEILRLIADINREHKAGISLIRPQIAKRVVEPASMFPDARNREVAEHFLNSCGFPRKYPFEPGLIPTSTMFAYPSLGKKTMSPIITGKDGRLSLIFNAGKYGWVKSALLVPNITADSLEIRGRKVVFRLDEGDSPIRFPHLMGKGALSARALEDSENATLALSAIGCSRFPHEEVEFKRHDSAFAGFVALKGNAEDSSAPKKRYFTCPPSQEFSVALVEIPLRDIRTFREHVSSSLGEPLSSRPSSLPRAEHPLLRTEQDAPGNPGEPFTPR